MDCKFLIAGTLSLFTVACADTLKDAATIAITNVTVLDGTGAPPRSNETVLIHGNRIVSIGASESVDVPADASMVDGQGKFLIPGLWDMHMHFSLLGGPSILPVFTANGVTGVRDNGSGDSVFVWQREIAEGRRMGPRIVSSGLAFVGYETPENAPGGWAQGIVSLDDVGPALRHRSETADFVKTQDSFMPRDRWSAIAAEATEYGMALAGHVPMSLTLEEAIQQGFTSIEHSLGFAMALTTDEADARARVMAANEDGDGYTALFEEDDRALGRVDERRLAAVAATMVENGVAFDANLQDLRAMAWSSSGQWNDDPRLLYLPEEIADSWREAAAGDFFNETNTGHLRRTFERMPQIVARLHEQGVMILAGTDAGAMFDFPGFDIHSELAMLVGGGLSPMNAIRTATVNPAMFMGMADSLGTVETGKLADLVLLDANPLDDIRNTERIAAVLQNGNYYDRSALDAMLAEVRRTPSR